MARGKFHVSEDGVARPCDAEDRECRLGAHHGTREEAQAAFEAEQASQVAQRLSRGAGTTPPPQEPFLGMVETEEGVWTGTRATPTALPLAVVTKALRDDVKVAKAQGVIPRGTTVTFKAAGSTIEARVAKLGDMAHTMVWEHSPELGTYRVVPSPRTQAVLDHVQSLMDSHNVYRTGASGILRRRFSSHVEMVSETYQTHLLETQAATRVARMRLDLARKTGLTDDDADAFGKAYDDWNDAVESRELAQIRQEVVSSISRGGPRSEPPTWNEVELLVNAKFMETHH